MGAYGFMSMNFNLVKLDWFLKLYSASASGSHTRAKRRHADAIKMVLIKTIL
jgi:2-oxoglutarate dehydrogenase E1 component